MVTSEGMSQVGYGPLRISRVEQVEQTAPYKRDDGREEDTEGWQDIDNLPWMKLSGLLHEEGNVLDEILTGIVNQRRDGSIESMKITRFKDGQHSV